VLEADGLPITHSLFHPSIDSLYLSRPLSLFYSCSLTPFNCQAKEFRQVLEAAGVRCDTDLRTNYTPGTRCASGVRVCVCVCWGGGDTKYGNDPWHVARTVKLFVCAAMRGCNMLGVQQMHGVLVRAWGPVNPCMCVCRAHVCCCACIIFLSVP
jgi:hypothetical protein